MNLPEEKDPYKQYILYSVGAHVALFILFTVKVVFFPSENLDYDKVVRVDMVALPDKVSKPPPIKDPEEDVAKEPEEDIPPPAAEEPPKPEPEKPKPIPEEPKPEPKPKKVKEEPKPKKEKPKKPEEKPVKPPKEKPAEEQNSAIARLKAMKNLRDKKAAAQKKFEYKGNEISKGSSLTGIQKLHHNSYLSDLDAHIKRYWNLPQWLANGSDKATVLLKISKSGKIKQMQFLSPSGNELFDEHVSGTLKKAEPLPSPPADLVSFFENKGVEVRFPD